MARFIHISDERKRSSILKNGIKARKAYDGQRFVFCHPIVRDFMKTNQWARELRRSGIKNFICVQFKIDDKELVLLGKYNEPKIQVSAAEAIKIADHHNTFSGLEILIKRKIESKEIEKIYNAPRITGWRYSVEAKGKEPFCRCKYCISGQIKSRRLRKNDEP